MWVTFLDTERLALIISSLPLLISRFRGLNPGSVFAEGYYVTTYRAADPSGNAVQCDVNIIVTGNYHSM